MNSIRQFEHWLKNGWFAPLVMLLIVLNFTVYFWWNNSVIALNSPNNELHNAVIDALTKENNELQRILFGDCNSDGLKKFKKDEIGPLNVDRKKLKEINLDNNKVHTSPKSPSQLAASLERATVRILASSPIDADGVSTGSGFFISNNLVVTGCN